MPMPRSKTKLVETAGRAALLFLAVATAHALGMPAKSRAQTAPPAPCQAGQAGSDCQPVEQVAPEGLIVPGDKIKITFFETLDLPEIKGGSTGRTDPPVRSFYQRMDLSGEFIVPPSGGINLPRLGSIKVAGRSPEDVQVILQDLYKTAIGRSADVNVGVVERPPVYVIGPVKTPGSYKYVSGMIVLHAMALAGGFERKGDASAVMSAYVREREREDAVLLRLRRLYARQARLTSERDGRTEIKASAALERIADPREISRLIEAEMAQFVATRRMDEEKVQQAKSALENLRTEQQALKSKLAQITQHAGRRSERLANLQRLQARGNVQTTTLAAVEADFFEIEARRKDADVRLAQVTQNIEQSERTLVQVPLDRKNVVDRELNATVEEITEAEALRSSQRALTEWARANLVENVNRSGEPSASFEIVRRVATGTVVIAAAETSPLQPGDVLRVRLVPIAEGTGGKSAKHGSSESDTRGW